MRTCRFLVLWLGFALAPLTAQAPPASPGLGDLLVAPTRVVFEGHKRTAELNLSNIGSTRATYRISLVRMEMDEVGRFTEVPFAEGPGQVALPSLIRYSPREVTLEPQEAQTIRLQVRKPAELPAGEYRIHMVFRAVPPASDQPEPVQTAGKGLGVKLTPVYGLAIPLIVRHGELSAQVKLAGLTLDLPARQITFQLLRSGTQSVYGNLTATLVTAAGKREPLCQADGVAVYQPNPSRTVTLPLAPGLDAAAFKGGRLLLSYALADTEGGALLAETALDLP